ncbi:MAG: hypothetical protein ACXAC6_10640 [Candidatus Hodarchaeales archaeon]|jgi:hypothetical protein
MLLSKRVLIPIIGILLVGGIAVSTIVLQALVDNEVQKQLENTETNINSVSITGITLYPMAANLTVNISASNPYDIVVTLDETQFKILFKGTQFGLINLPEIIIEEYSTSLIINTTFELSGVSWWVFANFFYDFINDDNVTFYVTGPLIMHAPALFLVVTSSITYETNITVTSEGILNPI